MSCQLEEVDLKPKVDGTTLITQGDKGEKCKRYTAVYIPPNHAADSKKLDVILWLHGWEISKVEDIFAPTNKSEITSLRESVFASKKDVVLIAPWLGYKYMGGGSLGLGDLGNGNGCGDYLHDVLKQIALYQGKSGSAPASGQSKSSGDQKSSDADQSKSGGLAIKNLIIACHSGGGDLMRDATGHLGDLEPMLKECWGFDCMYNSGHTYGVWAQGLPKVNCFFYLGTGSVDYLYFPGFWQFAFGTPNKAKKPGLQNLFLAAAKPDMGMELLDDQHVFQSMADIQDATRNKIKLNPYGEFRKKTDPTLDGKPGKRVEKDVVKAGKTVHTVDRIPGDYENATKPLTEHFKVVRDLFKPRIERMLHPPAPQADQ